MPENRKYFIHGEVLLITSRTEEGLPLVSSHIVNFHLWGILAKARSMYQIRLCHFIFLANHFHMLVVVENPEHVSAFIGYVKGETAHAINHLLGRRQKTLWKDGYDSPILLTSADVRKYIRYIYLNPARAGLVEKIGDYPGVSSWEMFTLGEESKVHKKLNRPSIMSLVSGALSINEQKRQVEIYHRTADLEYELQLEPFAWMDSFAEMDGVSKEELKAEILEEIKRGQNQLFDERKKQKRTVIGATSLRRESMLKAYVPKKSSPRMICICSDRSFRKRFITHYRTLCQIAREVFESWKHGETATRMPVGFFAPRMPNLSSALSLPS